jgi:hypothetical protein
MAIAQSCGDVVKVSLSEIARACLPLIASAMMAAFFEPRS